VYFEWKNFLQLISEKFFKKSLVLKQKVENKGVITNQKTRRYVA